jgi:hypothetical protein
LPALPYLYVAASRVGLLFNGRKRLRTLAVTALLALSVVESLAVVPHSLSFFNCIAGGPMNGHRHLLDANIDWGQDLLHLKRWYESHSRARPLHLAYFSDLFLDPQIAGADWELAPAANPETPADELARQGSTRLNPGWYAVSVNHLYGYRHLTQDKPAFIEFQQFQPVDRAGYSIYIYDLTAREP